MIPDSLSKTTGITRHPVMIAYFPSANGAQRAIADLMSERLSEQDFALLLLNGASSSIEHLVEPFSQGQASLSDDTEDSADRESEVGGGIATSTPDDDVSGPQEMDDSEDAAADMMYPPEGHSIGDEQVRDTEVAAITGFFETTRPGSTRPKIAEESVVKIALPGVGLLIGEGSFGSTLLERVYKEHDASLAWLAARFNVRPGEPGISVGKSGAVLGIDINAQGPNPDRVEEVLVADGAQWVRTY